jgi:hypothetical protein
MVPRKTLDWIIEIFEAFPDGQKAQEKTDPEELPSTIWFQV